VLYWNLIQAHKHVNHLLIYIFVLKSIYLPHHIASQLLRSETNGLCQPAVVTFRANPASSVRSAHI
jgi:hypothetical protein